MTMAEPARAGGAQNNDGLVTAICAAYGNAPANLIEILHELQARRGAIAEADSFAIAAALNLSRAEVHGVASFYPDFQQPRQTHRIVQICLGEACRAMGAGALFAAAEAQMGEGVKAVAVYCLGNCALSPAVMIDGVVHGRVTTAEAVLRLAAGEPA